MLPLLITVLLAVYILGPGLVSRSILSLYVPRRAVVQSRSEEWARSLTSGLIPLALAFFWARQARQLGHGGARTSVESVFSALYSEPFFNLHRTEFFAALNTFFWMNWSILWRLYAIVSLVSLLIMLAIYFYGPFRRWLNDHDVHEFWKWLLATLVLPRVSDWHVLLSRMLLPSRDLRLFVDVLTRNDNLYQGRLSDKTLGPDGTLINLRLAEPMRFRRERYLEAIKADPAITAEKFWNRIPGEIFVVMAADITTINVRYVEPRASVVTAPDVIAALRNLIARLEEPKTP